MTRRQRQLEELGELCHVGAVARAVDLAFEHAAEFGLDVDTVALLADAITRSDVSADVRRRFAVLCTPPR